MVVIGKPRGLNKGETYPCSLNKLKERFANTNIHIGIGMTRHFMIDSKVKRKPQIRGHVVASTQINNRERSMNRDGILCVYPIDSAVYPESKRHEFDMIHLDALYRWYTDQLTNPIAISGVNCLLIDYYDGSFTLVTYSFQ